MLLSPSCSLLFTQWWLIFPLCFSCHCSVTASKYWSVHSHSTSSWSWQVRWAILVDWHGGNMWGLQVSTVAQLTGRHYSTITWHRVGWQTRRGWHCWAITSLFEEGEIFNTQALQPGLQNGQFQRDVFPGSRLEIPVVGEREKEEREGEEEREINEIK